VLKGKTRNRKILKKNENLKGKVNEIKKLAYDAAKFRKTANQYVTDNCKAMFYSLPKVRTSS